MYIFLDDSASIKQEIKEEIKVEPIQNFIKDENSTDDDDEDKLVIKDEPISQDEAEEANVSAASSCEYNLSQFKKDESQFSEDESQEDIKDESFEPKEEDESDEDLPLVSLMFLHSQYQLLKI